MTWQLAQMLSLNSVVSPCPGTVSAGIYRLNRRLQLRLPMRQLPFIDIPSRSSRRRAACSRVIILWKSNPAVTPCCGIPLSESSATSRQRKKLKCFTVQQPKLIAWPNASVRHVQENLYGSASGVSADYPGNACVDIQLDIILNINSIIRWNGL